jgi:WbqC-like protein family
VRKTICINQSNYLPWRGYFDLIRKSDEFIIFDHVQYTHHDWRNRNRIKTPSGVQWLTVPVEHAGRLALHQCIDETRVLDGRWIRKHLKTLRHVYRTAPHFDAVMNWLEPLYMDVAAEQLLSTINMHFLRAICGRLAILTRLRRCTEFLAGGVLEDLDRTTRIIRLCQLAGATHYLSGPAAKVYLDERAMAAAGIAVEWMDYSGYPTYQQLWGEFEPLVSIVDLLFCTGVDAPKYIGSRSR